MKKQFLHVIPALAVALVAALAFASTGMNGEWQCELNAPEGSHFFAMAVSIDGENATGLIGDETLKGTFIDGRLELAGNHFVSEAGYTAELKMSLELSGEQLTGTASWDMYNAEFTGTRRN